MWHLEKLRSEQRVQLVALISEVLRSASGAKPNEIINIVYTVTEHPRGWAGLVLFRSTREGANRRLPKKATRSATSSRQRDE